MFYPTLLHMLQVSDRLLTHSLNKRKNNTQERKVEKPNTIFLTDGVYVEGCGSSSTNQPRLLITNLEIRQANSLIHSSIKPGLAPFPVGRSIFQKENEGASPSTPIVHQPRKSSQLTWGV